VRVCTDTPIHHEQVVRERGGLQWPGPDLRLVLRGHRRKALLLPRRRLLLRRRGRARHAIHAIHAIYTIHAIHAIYTIHAIHAIPAPDCLRIGIRGGPTSRPWG